MAQILEGINFDPMQKALESKLIPQKHVYYNSECINTIYPDQKYMVNTFVVRFTLCDYLAVVVIDDVFLKDETNFKLFSN
jgi:hypothetical protein